MCQSYDMAVERLAIHVQGNVISFVAHEFREIGWVLNEIADALEQDAQTVDSDEPSDADTPPQTQGRRR
jgi:hypothetical protein